MPRGPRIHSQLGLYHVMVRGNGKQILFESDDDRRRYLHKLYFCFKDVGVVLLSWCLMDNHVHLLVQDSKNMLHTAMARLNGSYAQYYNAKYGHVGHVFQDRYLSYPIRNERHLIKVVQYIHRNPEEARVCKADSYRWSSYQEFMGSPRLVNTHIILEILGSRANFKKLCLEKCSPQLRLEFNPRPSTETLMDIARDALAPIAPQSLTKLPREERNRCLRTLRDTGFSIRQIERLTGISRGIVEYATRNVEKDGEF